MIRRFWSLSAAGFAATAISFGPARMGFGLFLPEFRSAFALSSSAVGFVASLGYVGYVLGLVVAQAQLIRRGAGSPVVWGRAAATVGMGIVALAPSVPVLAFGVFLATSSAGLAALAVVLGGLSWRWSWALFAVGGAAALATNWVAFRRVGTDRSAGPEAGWRDQHGCAGSDVRLLVRSARYRPSTESLMRASVPKCVREVGRRHGCGARGPRSSCTTQARAARSARARRRRWRISGPPPPRRARSNESWPAGPRCGPRPWSLRLRGEGAVVVGCGP